jgi:hypothetical protein
MCGDGICKRACLHNLKQEDVLCACLTNLAADLPFVLPIATSLRKEKAANVRMLGRPEKNFRSYSV